MFCENCGSQIPDGSVFCENCGAKMEPEAAPVAPAATDAPAKKPVTFASLVEKVKAIHQKNKLIFPIAGAVLVVAIALIIVFSILGKQVSMNDYMSITMEGYDGYGQVNAEFGYMSFGMRAAGDKDSKEYGDHDEEEWFAALSSSEVSKDFRKNLKKAQTLVDSIAISYEYPEGESDGTLSNGDVIKFTIEYDEDAAEDLGLTIKDATFEYTVEGLQPIAQFDVLSYFDLKAEGYDGYGKVELVCNQSGTKQVGNITFTMESGANYIDYTTNEGYTGSIYVYINGDTYNKSNGDVISVELDISTDNYVYYGVELTGLKKDYTVSGLKETTEVDLLQYYKVEFAGLNGSGEAKVTPTQETLTVGDLTVDLASGEWKRDGDYVTSTYVRVSDSWGLSNEDVIKLYFNPSESTFSENGIKFKATEQELTVSNLAAYVTALSEIKDYSAQETAAKEVVNNYLLDDWAHAVHGRYWGSYSNQKIGEDMKLHKMILTTPKSTSSYTKNSLWMIFSVTVSDNEITTPTVYYFAVAQNDVAVYADGTLYSGEYYTKYAGYADYNTLYEEKINSNSFNLNIDVSE